MIDMLHFGELSSFDISSSNAENILSAQTKDGTGVVGGGVDGEA